MSGTSLDGLDLCLVNFWFDPVRKWCYEIERADTFAYSSEWTEALKNAHLLSLHSYLALDHQYGKLLGTCAKDFLKETQVRCIASHGHTIFHQPELGFTAQLGHGADIYAASGFPVVCDFRSVDVAMGGQGAPLVPAGEQMLFNSYDLLLNLGGIANLSIRNQEDRMTASDIAFANMALNFLAAEAGKAFDDQGKLASQGRRSKEIYALLEQASTLWKMRSSLGREQFEHFLKPLLSNQKYLLEDRLCTYTHFLSDEITAACAQIPVNEDEMPKRMLVTGGGAENTFLMGLLKAKVQSYAHVVVPNIQVIRYKEALIFAFLGLLRLMGKNNALHSVTGAVQDSVGGALYGAVK